MYDELGLHTLIERRWRSKLTFFYKIVNGLLPGYLYLYLKFPSQENYPLRSASTTRINPIPSRSKTCRKTFFLYSPNEWNKLKPEVRNAKQIGDFKKNNYYRKEGKLPFLYSQSSWCKTPCTS